MPDRSGMLYRLAIGIIWLNLLFYIAHVGVLSKGFIQYLNFLAIPYNPAARPRPTPAIEAVILQFIVTSSVNTLSDVITWLLPLASISRLQMKKTQKAGVMIVFATGFLSVANPYSPEYIH